MGLEQQITKGIQAGLQSIFGIEADLTTIQLQPCKKEFEGSHTFVTFPYLKAARCKPEDLGQKLGEYLLENQKEVQAFNVIKGFLNLSIAQTQWVDTVRKALNTPNYGHSPKKDSTIMVEYSSPNTNKPLHLGHLRNNFLGYSISQILKADGYQVTMANLINDRGIHICKSMVAYLHFGEGKTPDSEGIKGDKFVGDYYVAFDKAYKKEVQDLIKKGKTEEEAKKEAPIFKEAQAMLRQWEAGEAETVSLWKTMNNWVYDGFEKTYTKIGVAFDKYYYESETYLLGKDFVLGGLEKDVFYKKEDNSIWIDLSADGLDEKLVLRGDGTSVYMTQDLGTAELKYKDFNIDKSVYVVGNEQEYHFKVLKLILEKMQRPYAAGIYHLSYGMVELPHGKMKSREGTVVDADDLIDEMKATAESRTTDLGKIDGFDAQEKEELFHTLGQGALKYYLLKVDPRKKMLFNPEESIDFQGNTGPFIQYTYARIRSIIRKAEQEGINFSTFDNLDLNNEEEELAILLNDYPKAIQEAANRYEPSHIANYIFDLAKTYNRFYNSVKIFGATDGENALHFRIALCASVGKVIKDGMRLLGIQVPERM